MAAGLAGDQWNEGDVSCSVVRRVMLPNGFFTMDGMYETFLTIIGQMEVYPSVIASENDHYLPFLMTTTIMMQAVKAGIGREAAHAAIKEHALATVQDLRSGTVNENDLIERLATDERLGLPRKQLEQILDEGRQQVGSAHQQIMQFTNKVDKYAARFSAAADYQPESIL